MMKFCNTVVRMLIVGILIALVGPAAAQEAYPAKPIRFIVPYPPGGTTDPVARMTAAKLAERWAQPVIVDNRPGGSTIIGTNIVAKSPPDGYTILLASATFAISPSLRASLPYDTIKDFDLVATIAKSRYALLLHPSVPTNNLQEFIALAKSQPGQLNYASSGTGTALHLAGELFNLMTGVKLQHIPYKGSGALMSDLIGGQVQLAFTTPIATISHIKSGKLKAVAVTGETRVAVLPQVPTFTEAGLSGYDIAGWYGIVAPAGTPKGIIDKMSSEMAVILIMPDIREYLAKEGVEPFISTPKEFAALMKAELAQNSRIIKAANIKVED